MTLTGSPTLADDKPSEEPTPTFSYTTPTEKDYLRAFFEWGGVVTAGFLQYITEKGMVRNYDVRYNWPMFRQKLLMQKLEWDTNYIGTNFLGHMVGGSDYYYAARANHLSIAESFGMSVAGSLLWEYVGEVREIVSINDMIVTPLSGVAVGEPMTQLGAFFDRSAPTLHNRVLGVVFTPFKSLNDLLDGHTLARAESFDAYGFPANEWHEFHFAAGLAQTWQQDAAPGSAARSSQEWRFTLASHLARLPDYTGPGHHSMLFSDGNASSIDVSVAMLPDGVADLDIATQVVFAGQYTRDARLDSHGGLWGNGTLIGWSAGYQYTVHDYDRDRRRQIDQITSVEPLGVLFEHRGAFGAGRVFTRISAGADFAGVRPYALSAYRTRADAVALPYVIDQHEYYYGMGGRGAATVGIGAGHFEAQARLRFEAYAAVYAPVGTYDERTTLEERLSYALAGTPARVAVFAEQRARSGQMGHANAYRSELSLGVEIGARF